MAVSVRRCRSGTDLRRTGRGQRSDGARAHHRHERERRLAAPDGRGPRGLRRRRIPSGARGGSGAGATAAGTRDSGRDTGNATGGAGSEAGESALVGNPATPIRGHDPTRGSVGRAARTAPREEPGRHAGERLGRDRGRRPSTPPAVGLDEGRHCDPRCPREAREERLRKGHARPDAEDGSGCDVQLQGERRGAGACRCRAGDPHHSGRPRPPRALGCDARRRTSGSRLSRVGWI